MMRPDELCRLAVSRPRTVAAVSLIRCPGAWLSHHLKHFSGGCTGCQYSPPSAVNGTSPPARKGGPRRRTSRCARPRCPSPPRADPGAQPLLLRRPVHARPDERREVLRRRPSSSARPCTAARSARSSPPTPRASRSATTSCTSSAGASTPPCDAEHAVKVDAARPRRCRLPRRARHDRPHRLRRPAATSPPSRRATPSSSPAPRVPSAARSARSPSSRAPPGSSAPPAPTRRSSCSSRSTASTRRSTTRTARSREQLREAAPRRHRRLLRQRRRRPPRGGHRLPQRARPRRHLRHDLRSTTTPRPPPARATWPLIIGKRLRIEGILVSDHSDLQPQFVAGGRRLDRVRRAQVPRDGRRGHREQPGGVPRHAARRQHRQDDRRSQPVVAPSDRCGRGREPRVWRGGSRPATASPTWSSTRRRRGAKRRGQQPGTALRRRLQRLLPGCVRSVCGSACMGPHFRHGARPHTGLRAPRRVAPLPPNSAVDMLFVIPTDGQSSNAG